MRRILAERGSRRPPHPARAAPPQPARAHGARGPCCSRPTAPATTGWRTGVPWLTLVGAIDDATSTVTGASFRAAEDAAGYFTMLDRDGPPATGCPARLYTDRHGIFVKDPNRPLTLHEQLTGEPQLHAGRPGARRARHRLDRGAQPRRPRVASSGSGAPSRIASSRNCDGQGGDHHRGRQRGARGLPAGPQRALQGAGCQRRAGLAQLDAGAAARGPLLLPLRGGAWTPTPPSAGMAGRCPCRAGVTADSWAGQHVVLQERLDGSLWVSHEGDLYQLTAAPLDGAAPARAQGQPGARAHHPARAARADRRSRTLGSHGLGGPAQDHPWRRYPAVRPRAAVTESLSPWRSESLSSDTTPSLPVVGQ